LLIYAGENEGGPATSTVTLEEAQARLPELVSALQLGQELLITQGTQPVARLIPVLAAKPQPQFGICKGKLVVLVEEMST
jgi:antitoxin (DNA-binding transcriptional repressor) of toxin-antitoxin stability system